jgi:hypothetical protein
LLKNLRIRPCCQPRALPVGPAAAKRRVRQQQRSEIMRHLLPNVNSLLSLEYSGQTIAWLDNINFNNYLKRHLSKK